MKTKEFLSSQNVDYDSINVLEDEAGLAELRRLGARAVPVVSRGDEFVIAQVLRDVVDFLDLDVDAGPVLTPAELIAKLDVVLAAAGRYVGQFPDESLGALLPNRPRTYRVLCHHLFRLVEAFIEAARGAEFTYESMTAPPPEEMQTAAGIAAYGNGVRQKLHDWWAEAGEGAAANELATYFGPQRLGDILERTSWHAAQHARQLMMVLEGLEIAPDRPLTPADLAGLPLPEKVWDD